MKALGLWVEALWLWPRVESEASDASHRVSLSVE